MFFQRVYTFCCLLVLFQIFSRVEASQAAQAQLYANPQIYETYAPVLIPGVNISDVPSQNWGPFGRMLLGHTYLMSLNETPSSSGLSLKEHPWRYVVVVSCAKEAGKPKKIIKSLIKNLLPKAERKERLAIILGINEKINGFDEKDRKCDISKIMSKDDANELKMLEKKGVPVLILYSQWTSYRQDPKNYQATAAQVREKIYQELEILNKANPSGYNAQLGSLKAQDEKGKGISGGRPHGFPFGEMRADLINCEASKKFLRSLCGGTCGLYLHIQDSDFKDLTTKPIFYRFAKKTIIPDNETYLFKRYDALIDHWYNTRKGMPVLVGGAYVYKPEEKKVYFPDSKHKNQIASLASKWLSRFAIEKSNMKEHILGQYAPYGLYWHEPNTLVLIQEPQGRRIAGNIKLKKLLGNEDIRFGNFCEMQEFTEGYFAGYSDQARAEAMVFDAQCVLSTSMKRGADKDQFNVCFDGTFDERAQRFGLGKEGAQKTIAHMNNMPQGYALPRDVRSPLQTGFKNQMKKGATKCLEALFRCFDPYYLSGGPKKFTNSQFVTTLANYESCLDKKKSEIEGCEKILKDCYSAKIASFMLACAFELGLLDRVMFMDSFGFSSASSEPKSVTAMRLRLRSHLNHEPLGSSPEDFMETVVTGDPQNLPSARQVEQEAMRNLAASSASTSSVSSGGAASSSSQSIAAVSAAVKNQVACAIAQAVYKANASDRSATAKVLEMDPKTLDKLLNNTGAPKAGPKLFDLFMNMKLNPSYIRSCWKLTAEQIVQLKTLAGVQ